MRDVTRGRDLARAVLEKVKPQAAAAERKLGRRAVLAILAGADEASRKFVGLKETQLDPVGIGIEAVWLTDATTTAKTVGLVNELNERTDVDAIFVQFPLPMQIDAEAVANALAIAKDIDCSSERAEAMFHRGETAFTPVAPQAALELLADQLETLAGKHVAIYGQGDPFTRVLQTLLERAGAMVTAVDVRAESIAALPSEVAALVIGGAAPAGEVWELFERVPVLLDAAYYLPPHPAGWLPAAVRERIDVHLTQYGNVGPLTVAHLAAATVTAASVRL